MLRIYEALRSWFHRSAARIAVARKLAAFPHVSPASGLDREPCFLELASA